MQEDSSPDLAVYVVSEIRRRVRGADLTMMSFARQLDRSYDWVQRRIGRRPTVGVTLEDVQVFADGLGIHPRELFPSSELQTVVNVHAKGTDPAAVSAAIRAALSDQALGQK